MIRFTVPCSFKGHREKFPFEFYLGNTPHDEFHPLHFQMLWLKKKDGKFPAAVITSIGRLQRYAQHYKVNFEELVVYAFGPANKTKYRRVKPSFYEKFERKTNPSLLKDYWQKNPTLKPEVVTHAVKMILSGRSTSRLAKMLLPFLFLKTGKVSLKETLQSLDERLLEAADPKKDINYTYNSIHAFAVAADAHGGSLGKPALKKLEKFMGLPAGTQILALLDLRNMLEAWAMDDTALAEDTQVIMPYKLSDMRAELRDYFLPQQWSRKGKPAPSDMYKFSSDLFKGNHVPKSFLGSLAWAKKAAEAGNAKAQYVFGYHGFWIHKDYTSALKWMKKAAAQKEPYGFWGLGDAYLRGRGVKKDIHAALRYFKSAADAGLDKLSGEIGFCYLKLRGKHNYAKAKHYFDIALAEEPEGYVFHNLADMYKHGWGVKKSASLARKYYAQAKAADADYRQKKSSS